MLPERRQSLAEAGLYHKRRASRASEYPKDGKLHHDYTACDELARFSQHEHVLFFSGAQHSRKH